MNVPNGALIFFGGKHVDIPAGFERHAAATSRFLMGCDGVTDPGGTGGGNHTHTNGSHIHTQSHHHTIQIPGAVTSTNLLTGAGSIVYTDHTHAKTESADDTTSTDAFTVIGNSSSSRPNHIYTIVLTPTGNSDADFPPACIGFSERDLSHGNWSITTNTNFEDRFIYATAGDGGPIFGSDTHYHTTVAHTHTIANHNHADSNFGAIQLASPAYYDASLLPTAVGSTVHHRATNIQNTAITLAANGQAYNSATSLPPYNTFMAMEYNGASATDDIPDGLILGWTGTRANIPSGWEEVTSLRDKELRVTRIRNKIGDTGGTLTHTHTVDTHKHVTTGAATHTHTFTETNTNTVARTTARGGVAEPSEKHTHGSGGQIDGYVLFTDYSDYTITTESHLYQYLEIIWIRKKYDVTVDALGADITGGDVASE